MPEKHWCNTCKHSKHVAQWGGVAGVWWCTVCHAHALTLAFEEAVARDCAASWDAVEWWMAAGPVSEEEQGH